MLYREIIAVCFKIHTEHINTLCGQNVELLNVKPVGIYSNNWAVKGYNEPTFNFLYWEAYLAHFTSPFLGALAQLR
jgi:hypothetical protein